MNKVIETPFKDIHGETIKVGDIIIFGMLSQHWLVSQAQEDEDKWIKKGDFLITVVSEDSGKGYRETMADCGIEIVENATEICKNGCYTA